MTDKPFPETDKKQLPAKSEQQISSTTIPRPVFIRRAPGMPFEEFKEFCIRQFKEAGLLAGKSLPSRKRQLPDRE